MLASCRAPDYVLEANVHIVLRLLVRLHMGSISQVKLTAVPSYQSTVCVYSFAQELRLRKRVNLKTIDDVAELAKAELERLRKLAKAVVDGNQGGVAGSSGVQPGTGGGQPAKKAKHSEAVIEVFADESRLAKKGVVDDICIRFILWGNSQKVQLAGVLRLLLPLRSCFRGQSQNSPKSLVFEASSCIKPIHVKQTKAGVLRCIGCCLILPGVLALDSFGFIGRWELQRVLCSAAFLFSVKLRAT